MKAQKIASGHWYRLFYFIFGMKHQKYRPKNERAVKK